jgi:hypothetical protein
MAGSPAALHQGHFPMKQFRELVSADCLFRITPFRRDDGTYGYLEFKNTGSPAGPIWHQDSRGTSRFESLESTLLEAQGRVAWLRRETAWPARDHEQRMAAEYLPQWVECPFCKVRFSLGDPQRWGSGRHLTCGQRIAIAS